MKTPIVTQYCDNCQDERFCYLTTYKATVRFVCSICRAIEVYMPGLVVRS